MSNTAHPSCAICGAPARSPFRAPQPEIAPDLDMRPGEPVRSTLRDWVQMCSSCGAAAPDLAALPAGAAEVVRSPAYVALSTEASEETLPFRRWAMIQEAEGDRQGPAETLLQAAWAADDAAAMADAADLRRRVAALWGTPEDTETALRRLDVLRRVGDFDAAASWAEELRRRPLEEVAQQVVAFQVARIEARDIGRHLISSALPPPAHAPHVTHEKRPSPGVWSRLFRRG
jgi:hypothetical protein